MEYKVGDWVKCPGKSRKCWVYGCVVVVNNNATGQRLLVNRGYLNRDWYSPDEISPALKPDQIPEQVDELRDALQKMAQNKKE
ncbi:hypothetical protein LCGC14_0370050 [marine sediment metagenome]|uniref:Uncharacterized protein n=1 Tax=marine sediment metagenome TaxID=412755 RepID=A0A0F9VSQ4_9ZZZZ